MTRRKLTIAVLLRVLAVVGVCAYLSGRFLQAKYKMFVVPVVQRSEWFKGYDDYLQRRDPRLGARAQTRPAAAGWSTRAGSKAGRRL